MYDYTDTIMKLCFEDWLNETNIRNVRKASQVLKV